MRQSTSLQASSSPTSSCAENTVMPGLNYLKNQPPVVALADEAYPPWLWELLSPNKELSEKQKLRKENRAGIKGQNFMAQK